MKTLVLTNQKGGVGKSALCCLMAHHLVRLGLRVLVLDVDHQGNTTRALVKSGKPLQSATTADQIFTDPAASVEAGNFVLVPSDYDGLLELLDCPVDERNVLATNLRRFLRVRAADKFDVCLIDTGPNPDIRVLSALVSADFVLAPIDLGQEAIDGIGRLINAPEIGIATVMESGLNPSLKFLGMLPTRVKAVALHKENMRTIFSSSQYRSMLLTLVDEPKSGDDFAMVADRTVIQQCQATGQFIGEIRDQTAARDTWREVKPVLDRITHLMGVVQ